MTFHYPVRILARVRGELSHVWIESVLPAELEAKRRKIAKSHNRLILALLGVMFVGLLVLAVAVPRDSSHKPKLSGLITGVVMLVMAEAYGVYRVIRHDNELCREIGYTCPLCHQPLYEPRASTWLTGCCPKCKKKIV
ncbi:MAG TPA: hypothetical protein VGR48_18000 [Terriglobales bacterium]|nr:hypothetical protein [Terriglobales bacterium]